MPATLRNRIGRSLRRASVPFIIMEGCNPEIRPVFAARAMWLESRRWAGPDGGMDDRRRSMTEQALDDLEAVRVIVKTLDGFAEPERERILRWAREKMGLPSAPPPGASGQAVPIPPPARETGTTLPGQRQDIKTFVQSKNPPSDTQFAATVAYYYRFEAPESERKESITSADLQDATRKAGRDRLSRPAQTLVNAHQQGLLDKPERGAYAINTVGENLVAMALGAAAGTGAQTTRLRSRARPGVSPSAKQETTKDAEAEVGRAGGNGSRSTGLSHNASACGPYSRRPRQLAGPRRRRARHSQGNRSRLVQQPAACARLRWC